MTIRQTQRSFMAKLVVRIPYAWLVAFFLVPFAIVLKISLSQTAIAQPPYTPVFDLSAGWHGIVSFLAGLSLDNYALPRLRSALRSVLRQKPGDRRVLDAAFSSSSAIRSPMR